MKVESGRDATAGVEVDSGGDGDHEVEDEWERVS